MDKAARYLDLPPIKQRVTGLVIAILSGLAFWPMAVHAHGTDEIEVYWSVGFGVVVAASITLSVLGGVAIVRHRWESYSDSVSSQWVPVLLLVLGLFAITSSFDEYSRYTIAGVTIGGAVAWAVRDRTVTGCGSCADTTFGAILAHRMVEGTIIVGIYATNTTLGVVGVILLTVHAVVETALVGELYAVAGRLWSFVSMATVQLGFVLGIIFGNYTVGVLPDSVTVAVLAGFGGILLMVGVIDLQNIISEPRQ